MLRQAQHEDDGGKSEGRMSHMITDPKLLEILVCPVTRTRLHFDREKQELVSKAAGLAYPIRDGVPIMLASEARQLTDAERP
jgi:uncharacterized protein YbaR (Trm112 family)